MCIYDSVIIESQHFAVFSSWIKKKSGSHYNAKNIPYNFNLLYRASRDGNTNGAFHDKCDNKGATIVIAKIANSEQIVGEYNPLYWDSSNGYKSTRDSFIFSFTNRSNFQNAKVSYSDGRYSLTCFVDYGPAFGNNCNLYCRDGVWTWSYRNNDRCYPNIDNP